MNQQQNTQPEVNAEAQPGSWSQVIYLQQPGSSGAKGTNHLLHFILTILTGGLWAFVWVAVAMTNRKHKG